LVLGIWRIQASPPTSSDKVHQDYHLINGVIHLHTPVSGGHRTLDDYLNLARQNGIGIITITDHDTLAYSYSIHPLRWLINKTAEDESALRFGMSRYLELIRKRCESNPDVLIIDGVESAPFYYWTGTSIKTKQVGRLYTRHELTLHNRGKHILVLGLKTPPAYEDMPLIANGCSRYDAYHGNQNEAPYQDLINYVNARGGVTFWAHPEAEEKTLIGGVTLLTAPYPDALLGTQDYTGFSIFSEGYTKAGKIGGTWDKVLLEYCAGKRQKPVWAIGELDDYGTKQIDSIQTVFLLKDESLVVSPAGTNLYDGAINALKTGKMYAVIKGGTNPLLVLEQFTIEENGSLAYSGDEIAIKNEAFIKIKIAHQPATRKKVTVKLISNGVLIKEYNEALPFETTFQVGLPAAGGKAYYRLDITDEFGGKLISNPIFVK